MVLKKAGAVIQAAGQFEQDDSTDTAVLDRPTVADAPAADAAQIASTAISKAARMAVAAPRARMVTVLQDLKDALPALEFNTLSRLKGSNGLIMDNSQFRLGSWITLEAVSWHDQYVISPGDDSAGAKEAVRYSSDNKTIDSTGQSVSEYLDYLRTDEGYEKASVKHYVQLVGILLTAEKDAPHLIDTLVQISLSPGSCKLFNGYRLQESVKVHKGKRTLEGIDLIKLTAEVRTQDKNDFTLLKTSGV